MVDNSKGFSLVELLISLVLAAVVGLAGYSFITKNQRVSFASFTQAKAKQEVDKFSMNLSNELGNVVSIPEGTGTALMNRRPISCHEDAKPDEVASGLIPLPGVLASEIPSSLSSVDPSSRDVSDLPSDAIRVAYLSPNSQPITVINQPANGDAIEVETAASLQVGDFALISDGSSSDLFRITGINGNRLEHSSSLSVWNRSFPHTYGEFGLSFVQQIQVVTYAHDLDRKLLLRGDHSRDDGFTPLTHTFSGAAGLATFATTATPIATGIESFQIHYSMSDGDPSGIRNPQAGFPIEKDSTCLNELGFPLIRWIRIRITQSSAVAGGHSRTVDYVIDPINLKRPARNQAAQDLVAAPLYLEKPAPNGGGGGGGGGSGPSCPPSCGGSPGG